MFPRVTRVVGSWNRDQAVSSRRRLPPPLPPRREQALRIFGVATGDTSLYDKLRASAEAEEAERRLREVCPFL